MTTATAFVRTIRGSELATGDVIIGVLGGTTTVTGLNGSNIGEGAKYIYTEHGQLLIRLDDYYPVVNPQFIADEPIGWEGTD